jgi:BASS family bile acid:Na+ symporter
VAAGLGLLVPSAAAAGAVDILLALLVFVTALDIDPRRLLQVRRRLPLILLVAVIPLIVLAAVGWGLSQLVHGDTRDGVLALGLAPAEVASVGLIGLMGGAAELALAVLTISLVLSALAGPPVLALLSDAGSGAHPLPLLGRFALVVLAPLILGLLIRGATAKLADRGTELTLASTLIVVLLVFASLSDTRTAGIGAAALISVAFLGVSALLAVAAVRTGVAGLDPTLGFTIAMRDFAVASALAAGAFGHGATQVAGVYGAIMLVVAAALTSVVRRRRAGRG